MRAKAASAVGIAIAIALRFKLNVDDLNDFLDKHLHYLQIG